MEGDSNARFVRGRDPIGQVRRPRAATTTTPGEDMKPHMVMPTLRAERRAVMGRDDSNIVDPQAQKEVDRELEVMRYRHFKRKNNPLVRRSGGSAAAAHRGTPSAQRRTMAQTVKTMEEEARLTAFHPETQSRITVKQTRLPGETRSTAAGHSAITRETAGASAAPVREGDMRDAVGESRRHRMGRHGRNRMTAIQRMRGRKTDEDEERERRLKRLQDQNTARHRHMRNMTLPPTMVASKRAVGSVKDTSRHEVHYKAARPEAEAAPPQGGSDGDDEDPFAGIE